MRRITVHLKKTGEAVDQVVDGGREVGSAVASAPLIQTKTVALILFEWSRIENAEDVVIDADGLDLVGALASGPPIEGVHVLQNGKNFRARQLRVKRARQMSGSEMGLPKKYEDHGVRVAVADLGKFCGGMTVASPHLAQVFAGHAIESVDRFGMVASRNQQFTERCPVISPIEVEANALPEFAFIDLAAPPFVEDVLVAGKDSFDPEHDGAIAGQRPLLDE